MNLLLGQYSFLGESWDRSRGENHPVIPIKSIGMPPLLGKEGSLKKKLDTLFWELLLWDWIEALLRSWLSSRAGLGAWVVRPYEYAQMFVAVFLASQFSQIENSFLRKLSK